MVAKYKALHGSRANVSPAHFKSYLQYYKGQSGGDISKFRGVPQQYGYGLGGILRAIIRKIIPIGAKVIKAIKPVAKSAYKIARPHLKAAAQDLTKEAVGHIVNKLANRNSTEGQSGSGRRGRKRKSTTKAQRGGKRRRRAKKPKRKGRKRGKRRRRVKRKTGGKKRMTRFGRKNRRRRGRQRSGSPGDIF